MAGFGQASSNTWSELTSNAHGDIYNGDKVIPASVCTLLAIKY